MTTDLTIFGEDDFVKKMIELDSMPLDGLAMDDLTSLGVGLYGYAQNFGRRTAMTTFEAGKVLSHIRDRLKECKQWVKWQKEQGLPRSTVGIMVAFYERVQDLERIKGLTIMEGYRQFCVLPPKKKEQGALPKPSEETTEGEALPTSDLAREAEGFEESNVSLPVIHHDEAIDVTSRVLLQVPVDLDVLKKEIIESVTQELGKSVPHEIREELEVHRCSGEEVTKLLQIADEPMTLPDAVLAEALLKRPLGPDARLERALDEVTSAATRARSAGLDGPGALWIELLDLIARSAKGRLKRAG